jgi:hypothetical protein
MQYMVFLGVIISLLGIISYIKELLKGKAKPNKITWLMWSISPLIATAAAISDGVKLAILPTFMAGFGPLIVFIISFFYKESYWKTTKIDYVCGLLSVLALVVWYFTKDPNYAIVFSIMSDGMAVIPTWIKAYRHPETEVSMAYFWSALSAITSFFAIEALEVSSIAFPCYLIICNIAMILVINHKKIFKTKKV